MRIVVALLGLLAGALVGAAILVANPAARFEPGFEIDNQQAARLSIIESGTRGMAPGPATQLGLKDDRAGRLQDPALRYASVTIAVLEPQQGGANALGVRLSSVSSLNSLLRGQLFANSAWNLIWPGHGSLFLVGSDDQWPMLADAAKSLAIGNGFRPVDDVYPVTSRLQPGRFQGVVGASGALAGFAGRYREWSRPTVPAVGGYLEVEPHTR